ncbi:MAG TPA: 6-phosphogluconolactonase [Steroidobacteraceae bacterium]|jgi:6-phosphogluconolactonase|nr:6-phosphogluconolactonase [Steroidobacteraceae bacterium]
MGLKHFTDSDALESELAGAVAARLARACASRGYASLVVSGGHSPAGLFGQLCGQQLDWSHVFIALADERWVDPREPGSNERLVRERLLRENAAPARFLGLKNPASSPLLGAAAAWDALAKVPRPFDVTVLGMGDDGHTASLIPGSPGLRGALDPDAPPACVAMWSRVSPHERISLNLSALLQSRHISILILGEHKLQTYRLAAGEGAVEEMPIRGVLRQERVPADVVWAPI